MITKLWKLIVMLGLLVLTSGFAYSNDPSDSNFILSSQNLDLSLSSTIKYLPNDGLSEADISVSLTALGMPVIGETVTAQVTKGDGSLDVLESTTDETGVASFRFQAGRMPEPAEVTFSCSNASQTLKFPIAPITYLDVTLVTPEEYAKYLERQVAAAPIYKMQVSAFPEQLAADGGSLSTISVNLTNADGEPAPGVPLIAEVISGEGSLTMDQMATGSKGEFKFYFIPGFTPGTVTVAVTEPSTGLVTTTDIILVEAGPARIELQYYDPFSLDPAREGAILPADGFTSMDMVAKVTDLYGIPLSGAKLKIEIIDQGTGWVEVLDPVSDAAGLVEFKYYSGTSTGLVRLRAYVANGI